MTKIAFPSVAIQRAGSMTSLNNQNIAARWGYEKDFVDFRHTLQIWKRE
jgi:hypothetical protein